MSEKSAFRELKSAADRHAAQHTRQVGKTEAEPSHPIEELVTKSVKQKARKTASVSKPNDVAKPAESLEKTSDVITATHRTSGKDESVEVIIEPVQSAWEARRQSKTPGEQFYAPVVIPHPSGNRKTSPDDDYLADTFADLQAARSPTKFRWPDWQVLSSFARRPKMFGGILAMVLISVVGGNIVSAMQTSRENSELAEAQQRSLEHALALLEGRSQPNATKIPDNKTPLAMAGNNALSAGTIDQYVAKAMPNVVAGDPPPLGPTAPPESVSMRPLPAVDTAALPPSASLANSHASGTLKKPPIADRMDEDFGNLGVAQDKANARDNKKKPNRITNLREKTAGKGKVKDPLANLAVKGYVVNDHVPFKVNAIQSNQNGWKAQLVDGENKPYSSNEWVQSGTMLPNGWQVVDVQKAQIALLTPDGHVVTAPLDVR